MLLQQTAVWPSEPPISFSLVSLLSLLITLALLISGLLRFFWLVQPQWSVLFQKPRLSFQWLPGLYADKSQTIRKTHALTPQKNSFLLLHDRGSRTAELKVKCLFIYFSCKHHCSFLLHPFLQFYRSLSQYSQELYRRVGSFPAHLFHRYTSHSPSTCTSPHQHVQLHLSLLISTAKYFS